MNELQRIVHSCPCCGFDGLSAASYARIPKFPRRDLPPPYAQHFGLPSYEVCSCCGFEFGNDDDPGTSKPVTFEAYLEDWVRDGAQWFDASNRPSNWSLENQLDHAGIPVPRV